MLATRVTLSDDVLVPLPLDDDSLRRLKLEIHVLDDERCKCFRLGCTCSEEEEVSSAATSVPNRFLRASNAALTSPLASDMSDVITVSSAEVEQSKEMQRRGTGA